MAARARDPRQIGARPPPTSTGGRRVPEAPYVPLLRQMATYRGYTPWERLVPAQLQTPLPPPELQRLPPLVKPEEEVRAARRAERARIYEEAVSARQRRRQLEAEMSVAAATAAAAAPAVAVAPDVTTTTAETEEEIDVEVISTSESTSEEVQEVSVGHFSNGRKRWAARGRGHGGEPAARRARRGVEERPPNPLSPPLPPRPSPPPSTEATLPMRRVVQARQDEAVWLCNEARRRRIEADREWREIALRLDVEDRAKWEAWYKKVGTHLQWSVATVNMTLAALEGHWACARHGLWAYGHGYHSLQWLCFMLVHYM